MGLTEQQRRDFETKGWIVLGAVFEEEELDEMRREYDRILEKSMSIGEQGKRPFLYSPLLHLQSKAMCRYACDHRLLEVAMELVAPDIRLYWDQAVNKPAGATSNVKSMSIWIASSDPSVNDEVTNGAQPSATA